MQVPSNPLRRRRAVRALVCFLGLLASALVQAQPAFDKVFSPNQMGPGSTSLLTFTITNFGTGSPAVNAAFTSTLPSGLTLASPANPFTNCVDGLVTAVDGADTITFTNGRLAINEVCTVSVQVTAAAQGNYMSVSGDLTSSLGTSGNASDDLDVLIDRPGFSKSFSPSSVPFGGRSTLIFEVDNSIGTSDVFSLNFSDELPIGMTVADPANVTTTCPGGDTTALPGSSEILNFSPFLGTPLITAGGSCSLSVDVVSAINLDGLAPLVNVSESLTATTPFFVESGFATAQLQPTVTGDVILIQEFLSDPAIPGDPAAVRFTVQNLDRSNSLVDGTFVADLDATLVGLTATGLPVSDVCGVGSSLSGATQVTLSGANLPPEGSCTFDVMIQTPAGAATGDYPSQTTPLSGLIGGLPVTSVAPRDTLFISDAPVLSKTFLTNPAAGGSVVPLEFTITNPSLINTATDIEFSDNLAMFLSGVTVAALPAAGFCGAGSAAFTSLSNGQLLFSVIGANLAPGASCTFIIDLQLPPAPRTQTVTNVTSALTSTVAGQTETTNSATADLTIVGAPRLSKTFLPPAASPGDAVLLEFTLTHDEGAPADATAINFTDDLNAVLSGLVAVGLPLNDVCGAGSSLNGAGLLTFSGGTLAPGASCTFSVSVQVPAAALPGEYINTTSALTATVGGLAAESLAAEDRLFITGLELSLEFLNDTVLPGELLTARYTIENSSTTDATGLLFTQALTNALPGLAAEAPLPATPCGAGSGVTGTTFFIMVGGNLLAGESCTFEVGIRVPISALDGDYSTSTSNLIGSVGGSAVVLPPANDSFTVSSDRLVLQHAFIDDPVAPGDTVTLEYTLENLDAVSSITNIGFSHDLDAIATGIVAAGLPSNNVCGAGSTVGGTGLVNLSGASLPPGGTCSFAISVNVPPGTSPGTYASSTSAPTGLVGAAVVTGGQSSSELLVQTLSLSKAFLPPVLNIGAGPASTTLQFTIDNRGPIAAADLAFSDDLSAMLPGLVATNLPLNDVCGPGSAIDGTGLLSFSNGSLNPGQSCTFDVTVQTPAGAVGGVYTNLTSDLFSVGLSVAAPATADLTLVGAPILNIVPAVLDFGDLLLGTTSSELLSTLQNSGNDVLTISSIDGAAGDFALSSSSCPATPFDLAPGGSCTVGYQFSPSSVGLIMQSLAVGSNAASSPDALTLQGGGIQPELTISPTTLDFGDQLINTTSAPLTVTLISSGTAPLTVSTVTAPTGDFTFPSGTCPSAPFILLPGTNCTIDYTFSPTMTGAASSTISVTSDAPTSGSDSFDLTGNGTEAELFLDNTTIGFPNTGVDDPASIFDVLVTNIGDGPLTISAISDPGAPFSVATGVRGGPDCGGLPITLGAAASCTIRVTFDPTTPGPFSSSFDVTSNSASSPDTITLDGVGTQPGLTLSSNTIAFADTDVGLTATQSITLSSVGNADLDITAIADPGAPFSVLPGTCGAVPFTLAPMASCDIDVEFAPDAPTNFTASFEIDSNAPSSPDGVTLSGTGLQGVLALDSTDLIFPSIGIGDSAVLDVTLSNSGNLALTVTDLIGPNPPFSIVGGSCGATPFGLAPAASCTLAISFSPTEVGAVMGTIDVIHDGVNSPATINLSGSLQTLPVTTLSPAMLWFLASVMLLIGMMGVRRTG